MRYLIEVHTKPGTTQHRTYSFIVKSIKHMYYMIYQVYKICYNDIEAIKIYNLTMSTEKTITSNFNNITL